MPKEKTSPSNLSLVCEKKSVKPHFGQDYLMPKKCEINNPTTLFLLPHLILGTKKTLNLRIQKK